MASHRYDDILHLPRPVSSRHARMSMLDRGAQFAPFAALVGYESVLQESARLTDAERFLEESFVGAVKKIDLYRRTIWLEDGREVDMDSVCAVEGNWEEE